MGVMAHPLLWFGSNDCIFAKEESATIRLRQSKLVALLKKQTSVCREEKLPCSQDNMNVYNAYIQVNENV